MVTTKDVKTYNLTTGTTQTPLRVEQKRGRTQVFRNDKRKIFVVICDTDVAANKEVLAIAELSKKILKIPKGQSESVYRRRKENTMAKRKTTKGQTTIYKAYI
jgi:spore coat polysaccharide biosynthesis predicted glycosyltransferase SpsG